MSRALSDLLVLIDTVGGNNSVWLEASQIAFTAALDHAYTHVYTRVYVVRMRNH